MVAVHDRPRAHHAGQIVKYGAAGGMAAWRLMRNQDIGFESGEGGDILRPDRRRGQRMGQGFALLRAIGGTEADQIAVKFMPVT